VVVFVLVREDQNQHGYVDTFIAGIFGDEHAAADAEALQRLRAGAAGLMVEDEDSSDPAWQVAWRIEEHSLG
jgi:hypothetical protein